LVDGREEKSLGLESLYHWGAGFTGQKRFRQTGGVGGVKEDGCKSRMTSLTNFLRRNEEVSQKNLRGEMVGQGSNKQKDEAANGTGPKREEGAFNKVDGTEERENDITRYYIMEGRTGRGFSKNECSSQRARSGYLICQAGGLTVGKKIRNPKRIREVLIKIYQISFPKGILREGKRTRYYLLTNTWKRASLGHSNLYGFLLLVFNENHHQEAGDGREKGQLNACKERGKEGRIPKERGREA